MYIFYVESFGWLGILLVFDKQKNALSIELSWLFNKDPYNGFL